MRQGRGRGPIKGDAELSPRVGTLDPAGHSAAHAKPKFVKALANASFLDQPKTESPKATRALYGRLGTDRFYPAYVRDACLSSVLKSASVNVSPAASTFSSRCLTLLVPGIGKITFERLSSHASAI